jgi:hypothetical protein
MIQDITMLIKEHIGQRPEARAQDIYKLLYQGVFGVGHIISERAWEALVEEANRINLDEHLEDPLLETVSPDGSMVRINLRQYIKSGGDLEKLYRVMKESAKIEGDPAVFLKYWSQFKKLASVGVFSFSLDEIEALDDLIQKEGQKPRHHTEPYRITYYPAYRVVSRKIYEEEIELCG